MTLKVLHFADLHARDNDIKEIETCMDALVQTATDEEPDLIVMAGDTFDSRMVRLDSQAAKLVFDYYSMLADIAPMVVITGTPSHDGLAPQVLAHVQAEHPIHVADYPEQITFIHGLFVPMGNLHAGKPDAIITCIPTPTKQYWEKFGGENRSAKETDAEVAQAMSAMLAGFGAAASLWHGCPHILVAHCSVGGAFLSETQQLIGQDIELSREQIGYAEADVACLGHIHLHQQIGENIFYSGSIFRKDFGELEEKGYYIHELEGNKLTSSRFVNTPTRKLVKLKTDLTNGGRPIESLTNGGRPIESMMADGTWEYDIAGAFVRLEIKAWQDEADQLDLPAIRAAMGAAQDVEIRIQRVPRETVRSAHLLELQALRDKIREMALLRKEDVPESILAKADILETLEPDEIYGRLAA
jgi:DNA repair protein SbcD/Mre11